LKTKYSITMWCVVVLIVFGIFIYESTYQMSYIKIYEYDYYEHRTFFNSFYGLPKLFLVIFLYGLMMYLFVQALKNIDDKKHTKKSKKAIGKYDITVPPHVWNKLPHKYRAQIEEYYNKKKKQEGLT